MGRADQRAGHGRAGLPAADDAQRHLLRRHRSGAFCADLYDLFRQRSAGCLSHHPERAGRQHLHEHHPRPLWRHHLHSVAGGQQRGVPQVRGRCQLRPHSGRRRHQDRKRQGQRAGCWWRYDHQRHSGRVDLQGKQGQARFLRGRKLRDPVDVSLPHAERHHAQAEPGSGDGVGPQAGRKRPQVLGLVHAVAVGPIQVQARYLRAQIVLQAAQRHRRHL